MYAESKFVHFDKYCPTCENYKKQEDESPCDECLAIPARMNTHKPEFYKENKANKEKEKKS